MLKNKTAIITGSAKGIGRGIAETFAVNGANVVICDLDIEKGKETAEWIAKEYSVKTLFVEVNVADAESVNNMAKSAIETFGQIDILVNNAGITRDKLLLRMSENDWDMVININLKSVFNCTKALMQHMSKNRGGSIINIASVIGITGNIGQANYSASKGGVIALTKTSAKELAARNVRVNAIAPGFIETDMTELLSDKVKEQILTSVPFKRMGSVQEVGNVALFLASELSTYVTGQTITVDGGMVMQ